jgi:nucleotide-binding universal stress UspA family protein
MFKRILVPLDGSEFAEGILTWVRLLAEPAGAEIVLLRVAEYPVELYPTTNEYTLRDQAAARQLEQAKNAIRREVGNYLRRVAARPELAGLKVVVQTSDGPVVDAIIEHAKRFGSDLILLSTHGASGFSHWILGAVADMVLHQAAIPVLLAGPSAMEGMGATEWGNTRHDESNDAQSETSLDIRIAREVPMMAVGDDGSTAGY